jgi:hypothetical protein
VRKVHTRKLVTDQQNEQLRQTFSKFFVLVNACIKSIGKTENKNEAKEDQQGYSSDYNVFSEFE